MTPKLGPPDGGRSVVTADRHEVATTDGTAASPAPLSDFAQVLKIMRIMGLARMGLATALALCRPKAYPPIYEWEKGHYSAAAERAAALRALGLPPAWTYDEAELAKAKAATLPHTMTAIIALISQHHDPETSRELERYSKQHGI